MGRDSMGSGAGGDQWNRGQKQAPLKNNSNNRGGGGNRNNRGYSSSGGVQYTEDGEVVQPLTHSKNRWKPQKNNDAILNLEKKIKGILNKMTKEKFDRLAQQVISINIESIQFLDTMIARVFEKAISEPTFADMYANLCYMLSQKMVSLPFLHYFESNDGKFYWSADVATNDKEVVGPLQSMKECIEVATGEEERERMPRGDMNLELVEGKIIDGIFVKIMTTQDAGKEGEYYVVYETLEREEGEEAESSQQLSEPFETLEACKKHADKKNSFKRSLLNKCQDEFLKADIYEGWKVKYKDFESRKAGMKERDAAKEHDDLQLERSQCKKQMLGNTKFIGELYKKGMLKESIMHAVIQGILKISYNKETGEVKQLNPDDPIEEEDHESLSKLLVTIGKILDGPKSKAEFTIYFKLIKKFSQDTSINSRIRFMYRDLADLRSNKWVPRRKEETAKTIAEIRKDIEKEEAQQQRQSQQNFRDNRGGSAGGGGRRDDRNRGTSGGGTFGNTSRDQDILRNRGSDGGAFGRVSSLGAGGSGSRNGATPPPGAILRPGGGGGRVGQNFMANRAAAAAEKSSTAAANANAKTTTARTPPVASLRQSSAPKKAAAVDDETIRRKVKTMTMEFCNGSITSLEELVDTYKEFNGANGKCGQLCVDVVVNRYLESAPKEDDQRVKMGEQLVCLNEKGLLTKGDFEQGLGETLEFIGSIACDAPSAYKFAGELLGQFVGKGILTKEWCAGQIPDEVDREKVMSLIAG